jgi:hypothetical protein
MWRSGQIALRQPRNSDRPMVNRQRELLVMSPHVHPPDREMDDERVNAPTRALY